MKKKKIRTIIMFGHISHSLYLSLVLGHVKSLKKMRTWYNNIQTDTPCIYSLIGLQMTVSLIFSYISYHSGFFIWWWLMYIFILILIHMDIYFLCVNYMFFLKNYRKKMKKKNAKKKKSKIISTTKKKAAQRIKKRTCYRGKMPIFLSSANKL